MKKKGKQRAAGAFLFLILLLAAAGSYVYSVLQSPYRAYIEPKLLVVIPTGSSLDSIVHSMKQKGIVRYDWLLKALFLVHRTQSQAKAGEYVFDHPMTPVDVYEKLLKGESQYTVLTVPEGSSIFEIQQIFQEKGIPGTEAWKAALQSPGVFQELHKVDPLIGCPEGFLFPETYFVGKTDDAAFVLATMVRQFEKRITQAERAKAAESGMSLVQVVTLASLIEKETGQASERPLISGVFHNRMKLGMLLQCDPTVIYALKLEGRYRGVITREDLQYPSPYNTYTSSGLPPGPICNPGLASIQAALYPEQTDKLYFVSKNDGTHYFSATLAEHNRAVQKYRRP